MNYQQMSDGDLQAAWRGVTDELNRRTVLAAAPDDLDTVHTRVLEAHGIGPGDPWRPPASPVDAYPRQWTVTHDGRTWTSVESGNTTEPGPGPAWQEQPEPAVD